jgi:hypothetical protein
MDVALLGYQRVFPHKLAPTHSTSYVFSLSLEGERAKEGVLKLLQILSEPSFKTIYFFPTYLITARYITYCTVVIPWFLAYYEIYDYLLNFTLPYLYLLYVFYNVSPVSVKEYTV